MLQVELAQAQSELPQLIEAAAKGEEVIILHAAQPVAKLISLTRRSGDLQYGSARGSVIFSEDFDEPLEDFAEYS
jgi:antitoxin (DNA-binding transcriptional repressor) of toxin-antitoxin stability system